MMLAHAAVPSSRQETHGEPGTENLELLFQLAFRVSLS